MYEYTHTNIYTHIKYQIWQINEINLHVNVKEHGTRYRFTQNKVYTIIVMLLSLPHYSYRNEMQG